jgi:hypothetical protein
MSGLQVLPVVRAPRTFQIERACLGSDARSLKPQEKAGNPWALGLNLEHFASQPPVLVAAKARTRTVRWFDPKIAIRQIHMELLFRHGFPDVA